MPDFAKLGNPHLGSEFQLNDHRGVIVGIAKVASVGLFGVPTLYTTYKRAVQYIPNPRYHRLLRSSRSPRAQPTCQIIKQQVQALGYLALTKDEFMERYSDFYVYQTGMGTNLLIMTVISFYRRPVHFGPDVLHVHPGEPGKVRCAQGDRHQKPRTRC